MVEIDRLARRKKISTYFCLECIGLFGKGYTWNFNKGLRLACYNLINVYTTSPPTADNLAKLDPLGVGFNSSS